MDVWVVLVVVLFFSMAEFLYPTPKPFGAGAALCFGPVASTYVPTIVPTTGSVGNLGVVSVVNKRLLFVELNPVDI